VINKKIYKFTWICLMFFCLIAAANQAVGLELPLNLTYKETLTSKAGKAKIRMLHLTLAKTEFGYAITSSTDDSQSTSYALPNMRMYRSEFLRNDGFKLVAQCDGQKLTVFNQQGKKIKQKDIGDLPWHQHLILLNKFVLSDEDEISFVELQLAQQDTKIGVEEFRAIKEGKALREVNGEFIRTFKVRITLPEKWSHLWSAYAWFRQSDGLFVGFEQTLLPEEDKCVWELVTEE